MNNQKDTQKTDINTNLLGNSFTGLSKQNTLDLGAYEFATKKTEKLITALYLVSDCMETDDALKTKLRVLGVELLSDIYKLSTLSSIDKHSHISVSLTHIYELISFIEIAYTIGFISEMNTSILKKEFSFLITDLNASLNKDKHFTFTLDDKMFEVDKVKNMTSESPVSFTNNKSPLQSTQPIKKISSPLSNLADRQDRTNKILSLIKNKRDLSTGDAGVSIKDISLTFTDCSEKTIQRELNTLVSKGQLKKIGSKRWSRYSI